jgi:DNA-binding CsgD family transcriptional regulator
MVAMDALVDGDIASATAWCHEALRILRGYSSTPFAVFSLMCVARIAHTTRQYEQVAYFHGAVRHDIPFLESSMPPQFVAYHWRMLEESAQELGETAFDAAASRAEAAGRVAAVDNALTWTEQLAHGSHSRATERRDLPGRSNDGALSPRQTDVLVLMASGLTNKEIADRLGITPRTAEHHSEVIFRKLGVRGRTEAAAWAHRNGFMRA